MARMKGEEQSIAGEPLNNIAVDRFPPCVMERATFIGTFPSASLSRTSICKDFA